ncbi:uncharacterized mitochondrial protein AtMg00810-like [Benincasa hispida]|uniref:uncharacterized mitochondrial protein AtMg00810-like n=1 Tax=Benincasa hispida TaxID=102211 RepID=UPI00190267EA|nr:uncharacterized mitochondrial protein AtMg00810-like [Benincasa hispida]
MASNNTLQTALLYVDDIIITGTNPRVISKLVTTLDSKFAVKDLGQLHYFLEVQLHTVLDGVLLKQEKYVKDLLHHLDLGDLKPAPSPSVLNNQLSISDGTPLDNPYIYRSTIGALQYLTTTRLDITYAVNHLSQYLKKPTDVHW